MLSQVLRLVEALFDQPFDVFPSGDGALTVTTAGAAVAEMTTGPRRLRLVDFAFRCGLPKGIEANTSCVRVRPCLRVHVRAA